MEIGRNLLDGSSSTGLGWQPNLPSIVKGVLESAHTAVACHNCALSCVCGSSVFHGGRYIQFNDRLRRAGFATPGGRHEEEGRSPDPSPRIKVNSHFSRSFLTRFQALLGLIRRPGKRDHKIEDRRRPQGRNLSLRGLIPCVI